MIQNSHSYIDLQYKEFILSNKATSGDIQGNSDKSLLEPLFLNFRLENGDNILHLIYKDEKLLEDYYKSIRT